MLPADPLATVAVMALDALALALALALAKSDSDSDSDSRTAQFATLFALDMRARKTDFDDVLSGCCNRAWLVASALDQFVARDPMVREAVCDAQDALEGELPG